MSAFRTNILLIALVTAATVTGRSQSEKLPFSVDRPGISDYPTITPMGQLQVEAGIAYYQREHHRTMFLPNVMLRSALSSWLEVRLVNRFLRIDSAKENPDDKFYYFGAIEAKVFLAKEQGWRPAVSLLAGYSITPNSSNKLRGPLWGNYALLLFQNDLGNKWILNYNSGAVWNGYSSMSSLMYSFTIEYEINDQHGVFAEQSTFFNGSGRNDHWINVGYTYLDSSPCQLDFSMGINLNGEEPDYFFSAGYSTQFGYGNNQ